MNPKDKLGQDVCPGDIIAYSYSIGRSPALRIGKVLKLTPVECSWHARVAGVADFGGVGRSLRLIRPGTLWYPDRWIRLNPDAVPAEYKELLDQVDV